MSARKMPFPSKKELLAEAPRHVSIASLARKYKIGDSSFVARLEREGWRKDVDAGLSDTDPYTPSFAAEPDEEISETEVLRQRLADAEKANRARRKIDTFEERALQVLSDAIEARKPTYNPRVIPTSKLSKTQHEFVLLWSDLHAGEVVSEVETNGINSYDWKTMLKRHDYIRESVFSYADNRPYPVSKLRVCALGDMLSGDIHDELVETNEVPLAEATIQFAMDGAAWLESLLERFEKVEVTGVVGNHPRAKAKPQAKRAFNNADWLAYHAMRGFLKNQKAITWDIPKASAHPVMIGNKRCLLWHGDGVRSSMPGVPWGGVTRRATTLSQQYASKGMPLDHFFVGHFHNANAVDQGRIIMNGSVKGPDEYSLRAFGGGGEPQQLLLTFHPRNGLTDISLVDCGDR